MSSGSGAGGPAKAAPGTAVQGPAVPLALEAQGRPALCQDSFLRVEHVPLH